MKHLITTLLVAVGVLSATAQWHPDSLLSGYSYMTVPQPVSKGDTTTVSTIIRNDTRVNRSRGVLYIHGFNDYFFQAAMGDSVVAHGWNFRAVDLRRYGRSLRPGQRRFDVRNISEYYPDIDSAIVEMHRAQIDTIVLMAHSTGGLIASMYMNRAPMAKEVSALILNSPFLEWNMSWLMRDVAVPVVSTLGAVFPKMTISQGASSAYSESLLARYKGEWTYDTNKKLFISPNVTAGWVRAIERAQVWLHRHSDIRVPILLMHSARSVTGANASQGDAVLNVKDISRWGNRLGPDVTETTVDGALHDMILSPRQVRDRVYDDIFNFLDRF